MMRAIVSDLEAMREAAGGEVTRLLARLHDGETDAHARLFELVYEELKRIARWRLRGSGPDQTLQTTDLVHETYLRLVRPGNVRARDRAHFFAVAARAMRQIVIDHARARACVKRGDGRALVDIDQVQVGEPARPEAELLGLNAALEELEFYDARVGRVVELRFFGGLTVEEIGDVLSVSARTVKRDWRRARAFLQGHLSRAVE